MFITHLHLRRLPGPPGYHLLLFLGEILFGVLTVTLIRMEGLFERSCLDVGLVVVEVETALENRWTDFEVEREGQGVDSIGCSSNSTDSAGNSTFAVL